MKVFVMALVLTGCGFQPAAGDVAGTDSDVAGTDSSKLAIGFDAASQGRTSNATSLTWTHTVNANLSERLLVVGASLEKQSGATVVGITYAGVALLKASSVVGGGGVRAELWYLTAPAPGANPVVVTLSTMVGSDGAIGGSVSLFGVDQNDPIRTTATGGGTSASPSTSITVANEGAWIVDVVVIDNGNTVTAASPQLQRWNMSQGVSGSGSTLAGMLGPQVMKWTTSSDNWAQVAAEIKP